MNTSPTVTGSFATAHLPSIVPFESPIGAEVRGIDLAGGIGEADLAVIRSALDRHAVIVLRGQSIMPPDQVALARQLGELRESFYNRYSVPNTPELTVVSNIVEDGRAIGIADAGMLWHTDASYMPRPDMYTLLYSLQIPSRDGKVLGDTVFSSSHHAFAALPADLRERILPLKAIHSFTEHIEKKRRLNNLKREPLTAEQKAALPDVQHPIVRRHPRTGLPCLFVTEGHTSAVVGIEADESERLLNRLWQQTRDPAFHYRHHWQLGDLVIWDNCAVQHLAVFDYGEIPRRLHRAGVLGQAPLAMGNMA